MEYDFFALMENTPIYFTCKRLSATEYELVNVGYCELFFEEGDPPFRLVLTRGKRWTFDDPWPKEFLDEVVARVTAWEKEQAAKP